MRVSDLDKREATHPVAGDATIGKPRNRAVGNLNNHAERMLQIQRELLVAIRDQLVAAHLGSLQSRSRFSDALICWNRSAIFFAHAGPYFRRTWAGSRKNACSDGRRKPISTLSPHVRNPTPSWCTILTVVPIWFRKLLQTTVVVALPLDRKRHHQKS